MPNPRPPTPRNLGRWIGCNNIANLPESPGIYRLRRRHNGRIRTQYLGLSINIRTRIRNHPRRRTGDIVQYKLVSHNNRRYRDPVSNTNRTRLNIAEKLHLRQEFSNGQNCHRNSDLRAWVRSYNNLPRNRQTIRLTRRT
jgi:hypothetical protein